MLQVIPAIRWISPTAMLSSSQYLRARCVSSISLALRIVLGRSAWDHTLPSQARGLGQRLAFAGVTPPARLLELAAMAPPLSFIVYQVYVPAQEADALY